MRLSSIFAIGGVFTTAAVLSLVAARFAVATIEETSRNSVRNTLDENGMTWTEVDADGLQVFLAGTAPSEATRFKALSVAGSVVDAARVIDQMLVVEQGQIEPPRFSMEILRNDSGVSLIGLVPASMDRAGFVDKVSEVTEGAPVADFLEAADYPAPESWEAATDYAIRSLKDLTRTKISLDAGRIDVIAMTESPAEKADIEARLSRRLPAGVTLGLDISAPRPVITPFTLRFAIEDGAARFDACSADTETARERILAAARGAGLTGRANCLVGLGVPSPDWAEAAEKAIAAVADLGGGVVTLSDADIALLAPRGVAHDRFDDVVGALESALPEVFALKAALPEAPEVTEVQVPDFTATLSPEGLVQLRGRVTGAERATIDSFARARFSSDGVHMAARAVDGLPEGWTLRILAALDALSYLSHGFARVEPENLEIGGATGDADAQTAIAGLLADRLGEGARFSIDVRYEESLDEVAQLPTPQECEARIAEVQSSSKITFEPGSARVDISGAAIMDRIAEILRECGEITMEIGGHTDSQGRETMNQQLSLARANTVLDELRMRRVLTGSITAVGYGESQPIADNETEEGREANRRIDFRMIVPEEADAETALAAGDATSDEDAGAADAEGADDAGADTQSATQEGTSNEPD